MKKLFFVLYTFLALGACSPSDNTADKTAQETPSIDKDTVFSFDAEKLAVGCDTSSEMICTINTAIKCIINPEFEECENAKNRLPSFVFMIDESLQRPTFQSYQVDKITPRTDGAIEVHTKSSCNGNWFGLCNGNIIYVMKHIDSAWHIIDMYAVEF